MDEQTTQSTQPTSGQSDIEKNKIWAILGYIFPILFFIPLVSEDGKNSAYAKFHANQQLVILIGAFAINIVGGIIPFLGWFIILPLGWLAILFFVIMGIISASKGEMKPLPMIGGIKIIK